MAPTTAKPFDDVVLSTTNVRLCILFLLLIFSYIYCLLSFPPFNYTLTHKLYSRQLQPNNHIRISICTYIHHICTYIHHVRIRTTSSGWLRRHKKTHTLSLSLTHAIHIHTHSHNTTLIRGAQHWSLQLSCNQRMHVQDSVNSLGGTYQAHLNRNATHLVCEKPVGNKYNFAVRSMEGAAGMVCVFVCVYMLCVLCCVCVCLCGYVVFVMLWLLCCVCYVVCIYTHSHIHTYTHVYIATGREPMKLVNINWLESCVAAGGSHTHIHARLHIYLHTYICICNFEKHDYTCKFYFLN